MGLDNGYKPYKDIYQDNGEETATLVSGTDFIPDFGSRNTIKLWNITNSDADVNVIGWVGNTLLDRSLHEITIVNNSGILKTVTFDPHYVLTDEASCPSAPSIEIGAGGTAYFIGTAIYTDGNLIMTLRTGSQNDRKL